MDGTSPAELQPIVRGSPRVGKTRTVCLDLHAADPQTARTLLQDLASELGKLQVVHHVDQEVIQQSSTQADGSLTAFATLTIRFIKRIARSEAERLILMVVARKRRQQDRRARLRARRQARALQSRIQRGSNRAKRQRQQEKLKELKTKNKHSTGRPRSSWELAALAAAH